MDISERCPLNRANLLYDTACLEVKNELEFPIDLLTVSSECYQCDYTYWTTVPLQASLALVVPAVRKISLAAVKQGGGEQLCPISVLFKQHEIISWAIKNCSLTVEENGDNVYTPLYFFTAWVASVLLMTVFSKAVYQSRWLRNLCRCDPTTIDLQNDLGNPESSSDSLPLVQSELVPLRRLSGPRIFALDTFRGLTIALMIFVNYGGGKYWFFEHSAWNGVTIADFVFPWFSWAMGTSLVLSVRSKLRSCCTRLDIMYIALRRSVTLVVLGLLVNMFGHEDLSTARFFGVLQRLGVAYLIVCTLEIAFMKKQPRFQARRWWLPAELVESWRQWLVVLFMVAIHTVVTFLLPVPGCPTGYLGPGGAGNYSWVPLCTGGAARHIDTLVFPENHLYNHGPVKRVYHTPVPFDPEGILGTLTSCLTVYLGVVACNIMHCYNTTKQRCTHWLIWALFTGVAAGMLCNWSQEGGLIPVNKQLWSLSFALLTAAAAFFLFTSLFLVVDHFGWWSGSPFRYAGMNAILLYMGHIITRHTFPWSWKPYNLTNHNELFAMNIIGVILWLLIAKILHRHEIFLSV